MKIVVAGSRKYKDYDEAKKYIDECISELAPDEVVVISGGCSGADMLGERYAEECGLKVKRIKAEWSKYGKAAGPIRNKIMAKESDTVICFWDGVSTGTRSMIEEAKKEGTRVFVKLVSIPD